jgi:hypothetical protein
MLTLGFLSTVLAADEHHWSINPVLILVVLAIIVCIVWLVRRH